ncbi:MAG TPA: hypothetical protein VLZ44_07410 [Treponemataceae bacterium]|nr:hypothetical protein [Treponemataceae bacterium]
MKKGIRRRLMQSFFLASGIISLVVIIITFAVSSVVNTIANSYTSNAKLKEYSSLLVDVEESLEGYMSLRTYETINTYYTLRARFDMRSFDLSRYPSDNPILQSEYVVFQLVVSFLQNADSAVYAWRAGNTTETKKHYTHALNAYVFLSVCIKVHSLHVLVFQLLLLLWRGCLFSEVLYCGLQKVPVL